MPIFQYTVLDQSGTIRTGTSEASDSEILDYRLREQGFDVKDIQPVNQRANRTFPVRVARTDVLVFWIQFSIMIDAQVARWRSLDVAAEQAASPVFRNVLTKLSNQVMGGTPLYQAMELYPHVFDKPSVGIIRAGEVANALPDAVHRLIQFMERDRRRERV